MSNGGSSSKKKRNRKGGNRPVGSKQGFEIIEAFGKPSATDPKAYTHTPKSEKPTKAKRDRTIEWTAPDTIVYGTVLSDEQYDAKLSEGTGTLSFTPPKGTQLSAGKKSLRVDAKGTAEFNATFATREIEVLKADQTIAWSNPADIVYGTELTNAQLKATVTPTGGTLEYTPALEAILEAGDGQVLKVTAKETANLRAATAEVTINVKPAAPTIVWAEPAAVVYETKLSATQLNATSNSDGKLTYVPAIGTELKDIKTYWLTVEQAATKNYLAGQRQVRLVVATGPNGLRGYESVRQGVGWNVGNLSVAAQEVLSDWENDVGEMQTQGKQIMSDLSSMTGEEVIDYMNKLVPDSDDRQDPDEDDTYPNQIWKLPNGLQVRYKPNGDPRNIGKPMFCIEGRTTTDFSGGQNDIAFKVSVDGVPTAKGPGTTILPPDLDPSMQSYYIDGACGATHLRCQPKLDQVIEWSNPADIAFGTAYSATQMNAVLKKGDGTLTYEPAIGITSAQAGNNLTLKVTASATKRYNAATKEVKINITKAAQVIEWSDPADITFGTKLSSTQLNAKLNPGNGALVYTPGINKELNAGDNQVLKVEAKETKQYKAAVKEVKINVKRGEQNITWKNPANIVFGTLLTDKQLNASRRQDAKLTYTPPAGTKLDAGDNQVLRVEAAQVKNMNAGSKEVTINVLRAEQNLEWKRPAAIIYGTKLDGTQLNAKRTRGEGELVYAPPAGTQLEVGKDQTLTVTAQQTKNFSARSMTVKITVAQAEHVIEWQPLKTEIVYGTLLSAEQLNATSSTAEAPLEFSPPLDTKLEAGPNQTIKVTAKATKNYKATTREIKINVLQAEHVIEWDPPAEISYGTKLSESQLNAKCKTAESFDYLPAVGTTLEVGDNQTLQVTVAATNNYKSTVKEVKLNVKAATPTIQWDTPADITYGTLLTGTQLNATSNSDGGPTYVPAIDTVLEVGSGQTLKVTFAATKNFLEGSREVQLNVLPAPQVIQWSNPADISYGTALGDTQLNATTVGSQPGAEQLVYDPPVGTVLNAGAAQKLRVEAPANKNYEKAIKEVEINVLRITPVIEWKNPADMKAGDKLTTDQLNAICFNGGPLIYSPPLDTVMNAGDGQVLSVLIAETPNTLAATKQVIVNVKPAI